MTEREKMLAGQLYDASDAELADMRRRARALTRAYNTTTEDQDDERRRLLGQLFGRIGPGGAIEPPFHCDYGVHIFAGEKLYMNFGCVVLDPAEVHLGDNVFFGPGVQLLTATHPVEAAARVRGPELGHPIRVGHNVWIGGGAIICPGVTIGDDTTIGAGSVVVRDVPAGVLAVGNPCRVVRRIEATGGFGNPPRVPETKPERIGVSTRWSDMVIHNGTVYVVEVPASEQADVTTQTGEVLASLEQSLLQTGSSKAHLLMVTIFLADIADLDAFNAVWDAWVPAGTAPVRACVQARLGKPGYRVELQVTAAVADP